MFRCSQSGLSHVHNARTENPVKKCYSESMGSLLNHSKMPIDDFFSLQAPNRW